MTYLLALLAIVVLCGGWAIFQLWLARHDAEAGRRLNKCGNCGCERPADCERTEK